MRNRRPRQYTIRSIPPELDAALRKLARSQNKSLNEAALDALGRGVGLGSEPHRSHDLDRFAGTWVEDPAFDAALSDQDQVDPQAWR